jgi:protein-tyrosine phosphatase
LPVGVRDVMSRATRSIVTAVHSAAIDDALDILVVCTGNACRSPMGQAMLQRHLDERGVRAIVSSAGTSPWGTGATDDTMTVMRERDLDLTEHRNRRLTTELCGQADLVLGMTRDHVSFARMRCPEAEDRLFLVGELARLGASVGPRADSEAVSAWLLRVSAARPDGRPWGRGVDEVLDPVGESLHVHRATADRLDRDLGVIAELLAGRTLARDGS